jgi:phosphoribosylanthranilate isomerase
MARTRVKICCIASVEEAALAVACGADALGLVGQMPSGPGPIPLALAAEIAQRVPPPVATFLLSSAIDAEALGTEAALTRVTALQIVDRVAESTYPALRRRLPALKLVQVIHVEDESAVEEARRVAPHVDALLLDSGRPGAAVKELGGTGRVHDWALSRRVVEAASVPVFLAGGLDPANVGEAIGRVRPFGVDICSGVRAGRALDAGRLSAFMEVVRG